MTPYDNRELGFRGNVQDSYPWYGFKMTDLRLQPHLPWNSDIWYMWYMRVGCIARLNHDYNTHEIHDLIESRHEWNLIKCGISIQWFIWWGFFCRRINGGVLTLDTRQGYIKLQCALDISRSFFFEDLTIDSHERAMGCLSWVRSLCYHCNFCSMYIIVLYIPAIYRESTVLRSNQYCDIT